MTKLPVTYALAIYSQLEERTRGSLLREFADNGAEFLVLTADMIYKILTDPPYADRLLKEVASAGLTFLDAHGPFMGISDLCYPGEKYSRTLLLRHLTCLNIAADFGIRTYTLHNGGDFRFPEYTEAQLMDEIRRKLDVLLPEAEKLNVTVCLENGMPKLCFPDRLLTLKKEYPTPYLGFCYDSGHANVMDRGRDYENSLPKRNYAGSGYEIEWEDRALEKMLPYVVNCHLHDNDGSEDSHLLPGEGNIDWEKTMSLLNQAPRLEVIQSEVRFPRNDLSVRRLCESFRQLLKQGDSHE